MDLEDLDFLFGAPMKSYKDFKQELKHIVFEIKNIEEQTGGKLLFDDHQLCAENLLVEVRGLEKEFNNNAVYATAVQTSRRNYEEDGAIDFIAKKDEMVEKVTMFVQSFNQLDHKQRIVIYYSFFKGKYNEFIAQKLFVSEQTVRLIKPKAVEALMEQLAKEALMKQHRKTQSGSNDSDFSYVRKPKKLCDDE